MRLTLSAKKFSLNIYTHTNTNKTLSDCSPGHPGFKRHDWNVGDSSQLSHADDPHTHSTSWPNYSKQVSKSEHLIDTFALSRGSLTTLVVCIYLGQRDHHGKLQIWPRPYKQAALYPLFAFLSSIKSCLWFRVEAGPVALAWEIQAHLNPLDEGEVSTLKPYIHNDWASSQPQQTWEEGGSKQNRSETLILHSVERSDWKKLLPFLEQCELCRQKVFVSFQRQGQKALCAWHFLKCTFQ